MSVYIIVSASTAGQSWDEEETLRAIADVLDVTPGALDMHSVPLIGEWEGTREHSRAIPVGHPRDVLDWRNVHARAYYLREALGQDAVMVLADHTDRGERNAREVFENVERVSITLPGRDEARRENLGTSTQTDGEPIIPGVQNGSRWTTREDEYGTHVQAFV